MLFSLSIQVASIPFENPFPRHFTVLLEIGLFSLEKLIAAKTSLEFYFHCCPMSGNSMGFETRFEQHEYRILYLNVEMKTETSQRHASK